MHMSTGGIEVTASKQNLINFFKSVFFSYILVGIGYVLLEHAYAFVKGYEPTFSIVVDLVFGAPFWIFEPKINLFCGIATLLVSFITLRYVETNFFKRISTIFIIFLVVSVFSLFVVYFIGTFGIFLHESFLLVPFLLTVLIYIVMHKKGSM